MHHSWLIVCVAALAINPTAQAQGTYYDGDLLDPDHGYPYPDKPIYYLQYPPEIFDYCVDLYGIHSLRAVQCMRYENKQKREAETLLRGEVQDEQVRERIYDKCYAQWTERGMKWVHHCVRSEVSYYQIHGR